MNHSKDAVVKLIVNYQSKMRRLDETRPFTAALRNTMK
jgi:hypothetical protein